MKKNLYTKNTLKRHFNKNNFLHPFLKRILIEEYKLGVSFNKISNPLLNLVMDQFKQIIIQKVLVIHVILILN